jgi:hypothetical protein
MSLLLFSLSLVFSGCHKGNNTINYDYTTPDDETGAKAVNNFGIAVFSEGSIGVLDGATQTVAGPLLSGELGPDEEGGLLDVAITHDGMKALVSNWDSEEVYFIDMSNPTQPVVTGSITLDFYPEGIAITPNGGYALVTDGGSGTKIAVLDIGNQTQVEEYNNASLYHQAVAVAENGTVLTADCNHGLVNAFTLNMNGHLTYVASTDVSNGGKLDPLNLTISPDGKTVIVAPFVSTGSLAFPVLTITGPGQVSLTDMVTPSIDVGGSQSIIFNSHGTKAYVYCTPYLVGLAMDKASPQSGPEAFQYSIQPMFGSSYATNGYTNDVIVVLDVTSTGQAIDADTPIEVGFNSPNGFFGVHTLAMDYNDDLLFVSNPSSEDSKNFIQAVDIHTSGVYTIDVGSELVPAGVCFWNSGH